MHCTLDIYRYTDKNTCPQDSVALLLVVEGTRIIFARQPCKNGRARMYAQIHTLFASCAAQVELALLGTFSAMFSKCFLTNAWKGVNLWRSSSSKVFKQVSADRNFVVRRLETTTEIQKEFCERALVLGWRPGALDHVSFFAADPTGFYVGELEGKTICCASFVKYIPNFTMMGSYVVDKPY